MYEAARTEMELREKPFTPLVVIGKLNSNNCHRKLNNQQLTALQ